MSPLEGGHCLPYHRAYSHTIETADSRTEPTLGQTTNREGAQHLPLAENWIKDLLSMTLPTRAGLSFPHS